MISPSNWNSCPCWDVGVPSGTSHRDARCPCPVCGRPSVLVRSLDSYVHSDGSASDDCWPALARVPDVPCVDTWATFVESVRCRCGEGVVAPCRTPSGRPTAWHRDRLARALAVQARYPDFDCTCLCGADAVFVLSMDRVIHTDGTSNRLCWRRRLAGGSYPCLCGNSDTPIVRHSDDPIDCQP